MLETKVSVAQTELPEPTVESPEDLQKTVSSGIKLGRKLYDIFKQLGGNQTAIDAKTVLSALRQAQAEHTELATELNSIFELYKELGANPEDMEDLWLLTKLKTEQDTDSSIAELDPLSQTARQLGIVAMGKKLDGAIRFDETKRSYVITNGVVGEREIISGDTFCTRIAVDGLRNIGNGKKEVPQQYEGLDETEKIAISYLGLLMRASRTPSFDKNAGLKFNTALRDLLEKVKRAGLKPSELYTGYTNPETNIGMNLPERVRGIVQEINGLGLFIATGLDGRVATQSEDAKGADTVHTATTKTGEVTIFTIDWKSNKAELEKEGPTTSLKLSKTFNINLHLAIKSRSPLKLMAFLALGRDGATSEDFIDYHKLDPEILVEMKANIPRAISVALGANHRG